MRQKRFNATKDISAELKIIENEIELLESRKAKFENTLNDENLYSNPEEIKNVTIEYEEVKTKLKSSYSKWDELSEKLEAIESEFDL